MDHDWKCMNIATSEACHRSGVKMIMLSLFWLFLLSEPHWFWLRLGANNRRLDFNGVPCGKRLHSSPPSSSHQSRCSAAVIQDLHQCSAQSGGWGAHTRLHWPPLSLVTACVNSSFHHLGYLNENGHLNLKNFEKYFEKLSEVSCRTI